MPRRNMRLRLSSEAELDRLSEVSASDAERARTRWKTIAPAPFRALADVTELTGDDANAQ